MPEYLLLERDYGIELIDWSRLRGRDHRRTISHSLRHLVALGTGRLRDSSVIFSDGEHLGIPVALAKLALRMDTPHVMLGHHLTTTLKRRLLRVLSRQGGINRVAVHSTSQLETARAIGWPASELALIPYGIDTAFWSPVASDEEPMILSPGREHRDHRTLAEACRDIPVRVFLTGSSAHSPRARRRRPSEWTGTIEQAAVEYVELRRLYATASLVVIPLLPADFPAGVTTLLEAMSMGKAIVATATAGLDDYVRDGDTVRLVPPGRPDALRDAIKDLLGDPAQRRALGQRARQVAVSEFGLSLYTSRLMELLEGAA